MTIRAPFASGLMLAAACSASVVSAQVSASSTANNDISEQNWYQFDILLFNQKSQNSKNEQAPALTDHNFPLNTVALYTKEQLTVDKEYLPQPRLDSQPAQFSTEEAQAQETVSSGAAVPDELLGNPTPLAASISEDNKEVPFEYYEEKVNLVSSTEQLNILVPELADRVPDLDTGSLILLPSSMSGLSGQARSLRRSKDYSVVWQASFRIPFDRDSAPIPVKVEAGSKLGLNYQVEGTISLSQKRFLHADTNLWINTLNPIQPIDLILSGAPMLVPQQAQTAYPLLTSSYSDDLPNLPVDTFFYTENMPVTNSKRLQVSKLNYIDHPEIGILIKVTPYKLPENNQDEVGSSE